MSVRCVSHHRQRGIAVITALLLTTLAITLVASLFWQQQVQVRAIENQQLQLQKQWILRGALDWASLILREDAKHSSADHLDEPWAVPLADTRLDQYVENGSADDTISGATLSGGISDAQARYNLNNLYANGAIDPAEVAVFARLLDNVKMNAALAQATAEALAAAQHPGEVGTEMKPQVAAVNNDGQPGPQPMNLTQLEDLLAVSGFSQEMPGFSPEMPGFSQEMPGFSPEMIDKLKNFVIFLPRATPLNVNTAPAEVLAARFEALSLDEATALVTMRKTASFRDLADFTHRLPDKSFAAAANQASVETHYFLVDGKVRMNRAALDMQALIERNGANTKVIWIREY
ncbi:MAG: type II secretion system minor pseudopilin GspK [Gallionella sp.]|nr:type II secretion system minor pseudopilin GspK [Gallionella sp.]